MKRRDVLIGAACLAAAGGAYSLRPRRNVALLKGVTLAEAVPTAFGDWRSVDVADPLAVNGPGTLSAKLYNELVVRVYTNTTTGTQLLMLLAYGGRQTDELQLHRPEVCYPAFGYRLVRNERVDLPIGANVAIPARRILAEGNNQKDAILYWSRIGEYLPASGGEQREDRLRIALQGIIPDGLLCRFSVTIDQPDEGWATISAFVPQLMVAVPPSARKALIGTQRANGVAAA